MELMKSIYASCQHSCVLLKTETRIGISTLIWRRERKEEKPLYSVLIKKQGKENTPYPRSFGKATHGHGCRLVSLSRAHFPRHLSGHRCPGQSSEEGSARLARFTLPRILGAGYYGPLLSSGDSPSGEHIMIAGENVVPEEDGVSGQHFMVWVPSVDYW